MGRKILRGVATVFAFLALLQAVAKPHDDRLGAWLLFGVLIAFLFATDPKEDKKSEDS